MGCDACTAKQKQEYFEKLKADAREESKKQEKPIAICEGDEGHFLLNAFDAYAGNQRVVDVIYYVPETAAG